MKTSDEKYMKLALSLARRGAGKTSPNPMVGCVIVKNGRVVSSGYHAFCGGPHAEAVAIGKLAASSAGKKKLRGASLYANLEPCRHTKKKTPPCVPLIIKSGIKKVVAGMKDPNPAVSGKGFSDLRRAGIKAVSGVLENESRELNKVYVKNISLGMPYVIMKSAMTLDGKIASASGDSKWISSDESRAAVHRLRAACGAVLVGAGAVAADDPRLTARTKFATSGKPVRVAVTVSGKLPRRSRIFDGKAKTVVVTTKAGARRLAGVLADFAVLEKNSRGEFDFKDIMKALFARGIKSVLVEGGGETGWRAVKSGVVDEYLFFVAPKILGGRAAKTPADGEGFAKISSSLKLKITKVEFAGGDTAITAIPR